MQAGGEDENIYDEVYEFPESNAAGARAKVTRASRRSEVPSYYVGVDGH